MTEIHKWTLSDVHDVSIHTAYGSDPPRIYINSGDGTELVMHKLWKGETPADLLARAGNVVTLLNVGEAYPALVEAADMLCDALEDLISMKDVHVKADTLRDLLTKSAPPVKGGIAAVVGKWPGDETDEEFDAMIDEESKR